ncbi:MAG: hypothetical protein KAH03_04645, partial [Cocleimonas sp.]|nr:hypothetical protein [Cocleimonas sp.]
ECVEDDHADSKKANAGQYSVGDRVICPQLVVINNESTVKVVNPLGAYITAEKADGGNVADKLSSTFTIDKDNYNKYKLRCFASHSKIPIELQQNKYWDDEIRVKSSEIKDNLLTVPHKLAKTPWVVEINFVFVKATNGFPIGAIVPLKFIGGIQPAANKMSSLSRLTGSPPTGLWTTSADATNVYLGCSSDNINICSIDGKSTPFNIWKSDSVEIDVCVRQTYDNPYDVTFTQIALPEKESFDSEVVPIDKTRGLPIDFDMVLMNNKKGGATPYASGEMIFINQSGGSFTGYDNISQFQYFNPADNKIKLRISPSAKPTWNFFNRGDKKTFNVFDDNKSKDTEWTYVMRWQYEHSTRPCDHDTGWMRAGNGNFSETTLSLFSDTLGLTNDAGLAKKVDIYFRPNTTFSSTDVSLLGFWGAASMKGGGICYNRKATEKTKNNFTISYNKDNLIINHHNSNEMMV